MRFLIVLAALCMLVVPTQAQQYTPRDCCDVAAEWLSAQDEFDILDDRLDELSENRQLGIMLQNQIRLRFPFTEDDEQALNDIYRVIQSIDAETNELQGRQDALALRIIALNQELSTCYINNNEGPLVPTPDPFPMMP